jgi:hypothetical protein
VVGEVPVADVPAGPEVVPRRVLPDSPVAVRQMMISGATGLQRTVLDGVTVHHPKAPSAREPGRSPW